MIDFEPTPVGAAPVRLFNTPLECGFRALFVLAASRPSSCDLQRLISYDYLLVHSGDVEDAPSSLHPAVPDRGSEWIVKRDLLKSGLALMFARELVNKGLTEEGIVYTGSELTSAFVTLLRTSYADALRRRAAWLTTTFDAYSDARLQDYMTGHVGSWGTEFESLSAIRDIDL